MTTTSTTPGGYTSRFVAHVAQTTAHDEATSNSSNPHDRNRFRAFSADGTSTDVTKYPAGRVEDDNKVIADHVTINVDADGDAFKPPTTNTRSSRTDIITDTDKSTTSSTSSHLAISESESNLLEGGREDDNRVASVAPEDATTLVEGRSGNDEISLAAADRERDESILLAADDGDDSEARRRVVFGKRETSEDDSSAFGRIVVEDVDAVGEQGTSDLTNRPIEMIDERRGRSRSKESQTVSECSSSISGRTLSDDSEDSESDDSGSESKEDDEEEAEDDESRDENCNVKKERKEEEKEEGKTESGDKGSEISEKEEGSSTFGNDEETMVLSVSSSKGESSTTPDDRYERDLKRRSASIIDERSIEEMFDDNGWVITEDLQQDLQTVSAIPPGFGFTDDRVEKTELEDYSGTTRTEEAIPRTAERRHDEISDNIEDSSSTAIDHHVEQTIPSSEARASEDSPSRSHVYRQNSLGKNGWLVSDESESESERATSPGSQVPHHDRDVEGMSARSEASRGIEDSIAGGIDENGWVILDDDDDDDDDDRVGERSAQRSTIRSQTTDLVTKTNIENGGANLLANAARSKGERREERAPPVGANVSIPVQMVTTVFCVSVLCYTVLTNLLL